MSKKKTMLELQRVDVEQYHAIAKLPVTLILDDVRSEMNVGSMFRTADAFLIERICLCGITPLPPKAEIHKTALGAEQSVNWHHYPTALDAVQELHQQGYTVLAVEQVHDSVDLRQLAIEQGKRYALVLGNEVKGVNQQVVDACDGCVELPQCGTKHSLNIANCAAIVMWHCFQALMPR